MSTQSSLVTSRPSCGPMLRRRISPSPRRCRAASARARDRPRRDNLRTEPGPVRFIIIALAVTFLSVFVVLPLVVVFA